MSESWSPTDNMIDMKTTHLLAVHLSLVSLCIALFSGNILAQGKEQEVTGFTTTFPSMGTLVSLQSFSNDSEHVGKVFKHTEMEIDRLVQIFSDYAEESEVRWLTKDENINSWQSVSPELWDVIKASDEWYRLSDGAFDASIGQLSILWRKARQSKRIPTAEEIAIARSQSGWHHIELDEEKKSVRIDLAGLRLDFGAIAKGYIIEKAILNLAANGLPSSLVRAGGDLRCGDSPPGRQGWKIEIAKIDDSDDEPDRFFISNAAISSSGDLYQYIEMDGKRRSHVLDPKTGIGVEGPMMVTVIAPNAMEADASDTAICVLGHDIGMKLAKRRPDLKVRIVSRIGADDTVRPRVSQNGFDLLVPVP